MDNNSEPHCQDFAQTPDLLRRLVNAAWRYQHEHRDPFPLEYLDELAAAEGDGVRKLWCLYADLADLWVEDRNHPRVLALRQYRADRGLDD